jgi:hypothetical protein
VGFFIVSINVNFKQYFKEHIDLGIDLNLNKGEVDYMKPNISKKQHHSTARMMNIGDRKSVNMIAVSQSQPKKSLHPKIDLCIKTQKLTPLLDAEANSILDAYKIIPTLEEPKKAIKQTGVWIHMIEPNVFILSFEGNNNGKS